MSYRVKVLAAICEPRAPDSLNEDGILDLRDFALLLDGATGLGDPLPSLASSGAWLVNSLIREFKKYRDEEKRKTLRQMLGAALDNISAEFRSLGLAHLEPHRVPSAGGVAVCARADRLQLMRAGDCKLFRSRAGNVTEVFPPSPLEGLDAKAVNEMQMALNKKMTAKEARKAIAPTLQKHRALMNRKGGYGVIVPDTACMPFIDFVEIEASTGDRFLLVSDGFYAAFDVMKMMTPGAAMEMMASGQGQTIIEELRNLEANDDSCSRFPRLKPSDDASALLIEIA